MNNVHLPSWAKSAKEFTTILRAAMDSEYTSTKLNNWIDLIFGYKQRNEEAEAADNLFYPMTYDHNLVDPDTNVKKFHFKILKFLFKIEN